MTPADDQDHQQELALWIDQLTARIADYLDVHPNVDCMSLEVPADILCCHGDEAVADAIAWIPELLEDLAVEGEWRAEYDELTQEVQLARRS